MAKQYSENKTVRIPQEVTESQRLRLSFFRIVALHSGSAFVTALNVSGFFRVFLARQRGQFGVKYL
jgi:hypothetical protein